MVICIIYISGMCVLMCVCVGALGWWWSKTFVSPMPPQVGLAQSPTYQRSIGNLVPGGKNSVLN